MSAPTVSVRCTAPLTFGDAMNGYCTFAEIGKECGGEFEVETSVEGGEMWGQDADGNRGVWIPPYLIFENVLALCVCNHEPDTDDPDVNKQIERALEGYEWPCPGDDYPEEY